MSINFEFIPTNGIQLHTAIAGPENGDPVFLLHGFPDAWFGWEDQIGALAEAGFRVITPDQRGYNLSDKPLGVSNYRMVTLIEDILGLADGFGFDHFHLAGHDFGAMVSWNLAMRRPERLKSLAIANGPHPAVMQKYLRSNLSQMLKSWYAFFFQLPGLPERLVKANNWQILMRALPDDFTEEQRNRYREAWSQPGAMTSMINWYRSSLRGSRRSRMPSKIRVPTLVIWGQKDRHIGYEMAPLSVDLCHDGRLVMFKDATHWVMHDKPGEVSQLLIQHFRGE